MSRSTRAAGPAGRLLLPLIGLLSAALHAPPAARAADDGDGPRYRVRFALRAGQRWEFGSESRTEVKKQVTAEDQPETSSEQGSTAVRKGVMEVLAVRDGVPAALRVTFDKSCVSTTTANGRSDSAPFALAGRTVTIRRGQRGDVTCDAAELAGVTLDAGAAEELTGMIEADDSTWPARPVAVGEEWDANTSRLGRQFQLAPGDPIEVKCKLLRIGTVAGRRTADISFAGNIRKAQPGGRLTITLGGVTQVDLETGQPLRSDVIARTASRGTARVDGPAGPVAVRVTGQGRTEIHQTLTPVTPATTGPAATEPAAPATAPDTPAPAPSAGRSGGGP